MPKILPITGPYRNWDQQEQRFKPKTKDASELNAQLANTLNDYIKVANVWEQNNVVWTPRQLSAKSIHRPSEIGQNEILSFISSTQKSKKGQLLSCDHSAIICMNKK